MKDLYDTIDNFKFKINIIKDIFDRIINIFDSYYKINSDIIHNYDIKKRNYYILQNLQNLKNNNEEVIKYLNNIINNNNNIFEIYKFPNEKFFYNEYYGLYFIEMKNNLKEGKGILYFNKTKEPDCFKNGNFDDKDINIFINCYNKKNMKVILKII